MRVYLTGADGMLGTALRQELAARPETADWPVLGVSLADFDIGDETAVRDSIDAFRPDVVVHTAANAVVDSCERDPAPALRVNVGGTHHVAEACRRHGSRIDLHLQRLRLRRPGTRAYSGTTRATYPPRSACTA